MFKLPVDFDTAYETILLKIRSTLIRLFIKQYFINDFRLCCQFRKRKEVAEKLTSREDVFGTFCIDLFCTNFC